MANNKQNELNKIIDKLYPLLYYSRRYRPGS